MGAMKYLLDTNVVSECVKTRPNESVLHKLERHEHEIVTAAPVWHELQYGCQRLPRSRKRKIIESFLNDVVRHTLLILPYDDRAAEWHARERARLSSKGKTPPFVDGQIAAIAKVNGLVLVSRNIEHYEPFSAIKTENWHRT
jgi:tRNA(fMet)-specific endonuclease VapC